MFVGLGDDAGLWLGPSRSTTGTSGSNIVVGEKRLLLGPGMEIDGDAIYPSPSTVGGRNFWNNPDADRWRMWRDPSSSSAWYLAESTQAPVGSTPIEYWDAALGRYCGDSFYQASSIPSADGATVQFEARGALRGSAQGQYGGSPKTVSYYYPRYTAPSGGYGVFAAAGGADEGRTVVFGCPRWSLSGGSGLSGHITRLPDRVGGKWAYGGGPGLRWVDGVLVLGSHGSRNGWWEASEDPEPQSGLAMTFVDGGSGEAKEPATLTWYNYVRGDTTGETLLAEFPIWL